MTTEIAEDDEVLEKKTPDKVYWICRVFSDVGQDTILAETKYIHKLTALIRGSRGCSVYCERRKRWYIYAEGFLHAGICKIIPLEEGLEMSLNVFDTGEI